MSLIFEVPELQPGLGIAYAVTLAPSQPRGVSVASAAPDLLCRVRMQSQLHHEVSVGELLGGDIKINPSYTDIQLALCSDRGETVDYQNLMFGFRWYDGATILAEKQWPAANVTYIRSDQRWLITERVQHLPDRPYRLWAWLTDHGETFESEWNIVTPRPAQPYASWTWDGDVWQPPTPHPTEEPAEGFLWLWDESTVSWMQVIG